MTMQNDQKRRPGEDEEEEDEEDEEDEEEEEDEESHNAQRPSAQTPDRHLKPPAGCPGRTAPIPYLFAIGLAVGARTGG
jgi:hypothetical protein